jgi:RND family efflux transporter MFP subunit
VASITCGSRLEVRVFVPETIISDINKDEKVQVVFDALPNERFPGEVTEVGVSSTGMETTFPVTVQLHAKEDRIRPGMSAEVFFQLSSDQLRSTLYVPPVAVGEDRQGHFVFTVESVDEKTGVVHKKTVRVGELTSYGMEIVNGLTVGEYVVTAGIRHLSDGMKVRFNPEEKSLP